MNDSRKLMLSEEEGVSCNRPISGPTALPLSFSLVVLVHVTIRSKRMFVDSREFVGRGARDPSVSLLL